MFFVSSVGGKRREIGLGPAIDVSLSNARQRAAELRQAIIEGHDPFAERAATKVASRKQKFENFGEFADALVDELSAGWTNPVHLRQWRETFRTKARILRHLELQDVTTDAVLDVLRPLWVSQNETASRVRGSSEFWMRLEPGV
ncbi:Arm DNA-binding domain-containing protein [Sphingomonas psychrotolerans]|uniref:Arm DNA-binding domain-containing protein n=1 Tax=Sphingomonas psychrotolerans TaxID=1327635 RepID=UPI0013054051|nr:Arm DNA-binding domain-containing protein [Sphingomonas psychrotolerans]